MTYPPELREIERVARESYGKLLAIVSRRTGDFAAAEDALAEALRNAIETWPASGMPASPEAWIVTAACRRAADSSRRDARRARAAAELARLHGEITAPVEIQTFPDERLPVLFMCAHPQIEASARAPLMLQIGLGLTAERIAAAFLVSPHSMAQRLVRAKRAVRTRRSILTIPSTTQFAGRLDAVLTAIYTAFTAAAEDRLAGDAAPGGSLADEAVWLGRMVVTLLPEEPEALGLLSLMLFSHARRRARRTVVGEYVPFLEQNVADWDIDLIRDAERLLMTASAFGRVGRYQLEAAIQSAHTAGRFEGTTNWTAIVHLYGKLQELTSSVVVTLNRSAAMVHTDGAQAALHALDVVAGDAKLQRYQPYWATRAHLLELANRRAEARQAYMRAIGLTSDPGVRDFLLQRCAEADSTSVNERRPLRNA